MKHLFGFLCLLLTAVARAPAPAVAVRAVTVVDLTDGSLRSDQTVLIEGNRITTIGPTRQVKVRGDADVIDAARSYLIPGLWDAHVHSAGSVAWHFRLLVAHGVTSVRNMHTIVKAPLTTINAIKRQLAANELVGPRFLANGPIVDGDPPAWPETIVVRTEAEARATVNLLADGGADFIKVYDNLTREAYFAIIDEARRRRIPVDGHLPFRVSPQEAADAGQRTFEHLLDMAFGCSTAVDAVRKDTARALATYSSLSFSEQMLIPFRRERALYDSRDPNACAATIQADKRNGWRWCPRWSLVTTISTPRACCPTERACG